MESGGTGECGAVTFVQRFGGALNLNVHFHALILDGVYDPRDGLQFPDPEEIDPERLCRYAARPPLATERLTRLADGRLLYELKHRWRDGTTHIGFEPLELIEKLAALVPPPRFNLVRYHGVLAPAARHRAQVVPSGQAPGLDRETAHSECRARPGSGEHSQLEDSHIRPRPRNYSWAELMRRVFAVDVLECPACQGPMRVLAAIHPPEATRAILDCLGLPSRPPPVSPPARVAPTDLAQGS